MHVIENYLYNNYSNKQAVLIDLWKHFILRESEKQKYKFRICVPLTILIFLNI
jgi:hypothetical protein